EDGAGSGLAARRHAMGSLTGKTALVTGASRGMGRASALRLAQAGARVLVHFSTGAEEAERILAEIRKSGGGADAVGVDLAPADGPHELARRARKIAGDRLDILIANAGVSKAARIEDTTIEDFDRLPRPAAPADPWKRRQHRLRLVARRARGRRLAARLRRRQGGDRDHDQTFRFASRGARNPGQRGGARNRQDRHVEPRQDRERPGLRLGAADAEASRP